MSILQRKNICSIALTVMLSIVMLAGCERTEQAAVTSQSQASVDEGGELPLGQVVEFDGFTLRANVSGTEFLSEAMARQYGIEADPNLALLHVVVLEGQPDGGRVPVTAQLSAQYEDLIGHVEVIEMRPVEADGKVSYIGSVDTSTQRVFRFVIEAQPAGAQKPLQLNFEVLLDEVGAD